MYKKILILTLMVFASAAASEDTCSEPFSESDDVDELVSDSGAIKLSDLDEMLLYENEEYGFRVTYPSDWTAQEPDTNDLRVLVGFLAPGEDIDNALDYVTVQIEDLPTGMTLDEYTKAVLTNLRTYPSFELLAEGDMKISNEPAHVIAYGATFDQIDYQILLAYTIKDARAYIITYYALEEKYVEFENEAKGMINSFTLV